MGSSISPNEKRIAPLFFSAFLICCAPAPAETHETDVAPDATAPSEPTPSVPAQAPAPSAEPPRIDEKNPARNTAWEKLFAHIATHCYADELAPTDYAIKWLNHHLPRSSAPDDAPWPSAENKVFPAPHTPSADKRAAELRARFLGTPRSRIVDCFFSVPKRDDPEGPPETIQAHYVAYLPATLFREPERVRVALVLAPGGGIGGRTRPFLTQIPGKTIYDVAAGGLETKRRVDGWLSAHPEASPPVVVALHSNGEEYAGSATAFLTADVPGHIGEALLGGVDRKAITLGVEGVSSGARTIVLTLRDKPEAFNTIGLSCMACGGVDERKGRLGPKKVIDDWHHKLAERVKRGELRFRFAIGSRDNQLPCNRALHEALGKVGIFDSSRPPEFFGCAPGAPEGERTCDIKLDGFYIYRGELHDYHFLSRSWDEQLAFHLEALSAIHEAKRAGP